MTHFRCRCMLAGNRRGDQDIQRAGSVEEAELLPDLSGRSHYPVAPCCGPSAAHPSSSSPWPLAENCRRSRPGHLWDRRRTADPSLCPLGHRDSGCVGQKVH